MPTFLVIRFVKGIRNIRNRVIFLYMSFPFYIASRCTKMARLLGHTVSIFIYIMKFKLFFFVPIISKRSTKKFWQVSGMPPTMATFTVLWLLFPRSGCGSGCRFSRTRIQFVVVVYHVTIVAIGHGLLKKFWPFGNRLRSTHCREFLYMKLCRPAYFVRTTQFLPHPGHE